MFIHSPSGLCSDKRVSTRVKRLTSHNNNTQACKVAPLTYMVHAALLVIAGTAFLPHQAYAQTVVTTAPAGKAYHISAGKMSNVLTRFAGQAGVALTFDPALVEGLESQGINGTYSVDTGFATLLTAAGFEAIKHNDTEYTLKRIPVSALHQDDKALPMISVVAANANNATTEGTGAYTTSSMSTATGLSLSQRQTPQSVSIMSRQQMDDFNMSTLQDVAHATPGLYSKETGISEQEKTFFARGFVLNHISVDGLPLDVTDFNQRNVSADMVMYDRVEVVRGATGLMEGAGTPGGSINLIRKRPVATPLFNATASLGSWNNKQMTLDGSGALNEAGTLRGRLAGSLSDSDSYVDVVKTKNSTLYGIVEADLGADTTLGVGFSVQRTRTKGMFTGLPTYIDGRHMDLPRSTFLNNADSYQDRDNNVLFADMEHRFANGWRGKFTTTHITADSDSRYANNNRIAGQPYQFTQQETGWAYSTRQFVADLRVSGPFALLGRQHELLVGASYRKDDSDAKQTWDSIGSNIVDIGNWNPHAAPVTGGPAEPYNWDRKNTEKGLYAAGNFSLADPLHLIIGGRLGWYAGDVTGWYGVNPKWRRSLEESAKFIPYVGLVYDINNAHSVYGSVTQIFQPQSSMDVSGNTLAPLTGTNYEMGIKGEYFGGKMNTSAAIFRIEQSNRAMRDEVNCPTGSPISCSRAAGEIVSEGVDLEVSGSPLPGLQVSGGYTFVLAKYTKDSNLKNVGQRLSTDEPRHLFKLFANYRLPGALDKWNVGASTYAQSKVYRDETNYHTSQGSYFLFGLTAGYKVSNNVQLRLNIDNLFDRTYYQALGYGWSGASERYGAPRSVMLSMNYAM